MKKTKLSYPIISYEKAQKKVKRSIDNIGKNKGVDSNTFFEKLLLKDGIIITSYHP